MENYFEVQMERDALHGISALGLAHMGDGVFELLVRSWLCVHGKATSGNLHRATVSHVAAPAQARRMERMLPHLTEEELAVYKRGRNAHVHAVPKNATPGEYAKATGLECLFGWLFLQGRTARINELFNLTMEEDHAV
ncbi:MAG: ribonuclease III [Oscillospiraceae bacterium]|nr:ribonuclease III [Oscillospiraceae bacterium]